MVAGATYSILHGTHQVSVGMASSDASNGGPKEITEK